MKLFGHFSFLQLIFRLCLDARLWKVYILATSLGWQASSLGSNSSFVDDPVVDLAMPGTKGQISQNKLRRCQHQFSESISYYQKLYKFLPKGWQPKAKTAFLKLKDRQASDCRKRSVQRAVHGTLSHHTGKIGVLAPLQGKDRDLGVHFAEAIKTYYKDVKLFERYGVLGDSRSHAKAFHQQLAKLVFVDRVSILIGGVTKYEAKMLNLWSEKLQIPTLILHSPAFRQKLSPFAFYISPDQQQMAISLATYIHNRAFQKVAIFHPEHRQKEFVFHLQDRLNRDKKNIVKIAHYNPKDYSSLALGIRELFKIDDPERHEELAELIEKKKLEAEEAGIPFNPEGIMLPPEQTVDTIIIVDNFKTVRHFINILKYLKVPKIPLLGTQQWRAPELFNPPEPFLAGSIFVDYIGSYLRLPYRLKVTTQESPYFTTPEQTMALDLWLIGRHSIDIAERVRTALPEDRRDIRKILGELRTRKKDPFFQSQRVFDQKQVSNWPTFLFSLSESGLYPMFQRAAEHALLSPTPYR
ncbi:amino acid ABC transporter substrate-binding protein [Pseudobacteriovorax antillogorgiicola]|uniref:Leucine-binding protein domain-containing protein n=1 Tax=Pseudobacteriovorax antillogorgiicola TaxID=1513793 RepID=A0A1Y6BP92_9BACT|nr:amino acid ABC transporter substrate-binding protein [Pseudobacteriovorax antillogorgiicola]TCS53878.1 hypothetical protein EDD56_107187 [Pseudobacteriovorax antillogorgiicola]SMF21162.1 hypothetical protein SAMN06296036_10785 [Pseudobacteriovorax antillogorgiicola]